MLRLVAVLILAWTALAPVSAEAAGCETHPDFTAAFRRSLNTALLNVQSQEQLAYVIYRLRRIHREVTEHELTHYYAAKGWGSKPEYDTIKLYGKIYRTGGCVRLRRGAPLKIAIIAALAPNRPSAQDRRVAAEARRLLAEADRRRRLWESLQRQHGR